MTAPALIRKADVATQRCSCTFTMDGKTYAIKREVTRVDDWRDTIFGRVNFGYVRFGPQRIVQVEP